MVFTLDIIMQCNAMPCHVNRYFVMLVDIYTFVVRIMVHKNSPENRKKETEKEKINKKHWHRIQLYNWLYWDRKKRETLKIMSVINND